MEQKDFSHFKYYVKRLKEMGFKDVGSNEENKHRRLDFIKNIDECRYCYACFMDYPVYSQDCFPYIMLCALRGDRVRTYVVTIYKIGFDKDFQKNAKSLCRRIQESTSYRVKIINEYPTWRSAFNQLVKDYHELEKNEHERIHKGVSIHET